MAVSRPLRIFHWGSADDSRRLGTQLTRRGVEHEEVGSLLRFEDLKRDHAKADIVTFDTAFTREVEAFLSLLKLVAGPGGKLPHVFAIVHDHSPATAKEIIEKHPDKLHIGVVEKSPLEDLAKAIGEHYGKAKA
jgi:hypothetical protein